MLGTDELHLLEPLDATAPQAAHMFHELRKLGYKAAVGWVVRPPAAGNETIYGAYTREAGDTGRTEVAIARLQRWRREQNVMWVIELLRADGITLRDRFVFNLAARARRCEPDASPAVRHCVRTRPRTGEQERPAACGPTDPRGVGCCRYLKLRVARRNARPRSLERAGWCDDRRVHRRCHATENHSPNGREVHHERQRGDSLRLAATSGRHCLAGNVGLRTRSLPRDPGPPRCRDPRPLPS